MWWLISLAVLLPAAVYCFHPADLELFKLQEAIKKDIGPKTNFYSWLGVKKNANNKAIVKAYRKLSRQLHPDRSPLAGADERFARLNQVYKTLRSEARERYDYYLSKGFPLYDEAKQEFYNKRYRPSLFMAVVLVISLGSGVEFLIRKLTAYRRRESINNWIISAINKAAEESDSGIIVKTTKVDVGPHTFYVHADRQVTFQGLPLKPELVEEPTWRDLFLVSTVLKFVNPQQQAQTEDNVANTAESSSVAEEQFEVVDSKDAVSEKKEDEPVVKKGAARRRPPGARGKGRVF